jgi:hypothetical protein
MPITSKLSLLLLPFLMFTIFYSSNSYSISTQYFFQLGTKDHYLLIQSDENLSDLYQIKTKAFSMKNTNFHSFRVFKGSLERLQEVPVMTSGIDHHGRIDIVLATGDSIQIPLQHTSYEKPFYRLANGSKITITPREYDNDKTKILQEEYVFEITLDHLDNKVTFPQDLKWGLRIKAENFEGDLYKKCKINSNHPSEIKKACGSHIFTTSIGGTGLKFEKEEVEGIRRFRLIAKKDCYGYKAISDYSTMKCLLELLPKPNGSVCPIWLKDEDVQYNFLIKKINKRQIEDQ